MIVSASVLAYYDVNKPVVIQCDASQSGLGATLLQESRPMAYSSRVMTQTEENYAQVEKELLAIVLCMWEIWSVHFWKKQRNCTVRPQTTGNHIQEANPQFAKTPPTHAPPPAELWHPSGIPERRDPVLDWHIKPRILGKWTSESDREQWPQWRQTSTWPILLNWLSQAPLSRHSQWFLGRTLKIVQCGT